MNTHGAQGRRGSKTRSSQISRDSLSSKKGERAVPSPPGRGAVRTPRPTRWGFAAPIHVRILEVFAFHEPFPLIPSFSPSGGEGARRAVEGDSDRFMAPIHVRILEVFAFHEPPPHPFPLPLRGGEGGRRSGEGRFMVPMHAQKRKEALHEPPP